MKFHERVIDQTARRFGIQISRVGSESNRLPIEATPEEIELIASLRPYTMTSAERIWSLLHAVQYVVDEGISGDFVECGVWRGGSVMAMAHQLRRIGVTDRRIWLYDTFAGMTQPTEADVEAILKAGAARAVIGSKAVSDPQSVIGWIARFGAEQIAAAFDVRIENGAPYPTTHGWTENSRKPLLQLL